MHLPLSILLTTLLLRQTSSVHIGFCTFFTHGDDHYLEREASGIGGDHFPPDIRSYFHYDEDCHPRVKKNVCYGEDDEIPLVTLFTIKKGDKPLNGWLRVNIKFKKVIDAFYIAGEIDEKFEGVDEVNRYGGKNQAKGEFVSEFPFNDKCPKSDTTPYMLIPCAGVGRSEVGLSNAVLYVEPAVGMWDHTTQKTWHGIIPPGVTGRNEFNLYYRFSDDYCSLRRFYFRLITLIEIKKNHWKKMYPARTPYIVPKKFTGAWDPVEDASGLDCTVNADKADWVHKYEIDRLEFGNKATCYGGRYNDEKYSYGNRFLDEVENKTYYSSRCRHLNALFNESWPHPETVKYLQMQHCAFSKTSQFPTLLPQMDIYENYIQQFYKNNEKKCNCLIEWPKIPEPEIIVIDPKPRYTTDDSGSTPPEEDTTTSTTDVTDVTTPDVTTEDDGGTGGTTNPDDDDGNSTSTTTTIKYDFERKLDPVKGVRADFKNGKILWRTRVGHGVMMIILTIFITPLSILVSRYYKETFMDCRIMYFRVWYLLHMQSIPSSLVFILGGLISIMIGRLILGTSLSTEGIAHRLIGWFMIYIYLVMILFGGIRCFQDSARKICIFCHWFFGNVFYFGCLILVLISVGIPGSPLADEDASYRVDTGSTNSAYFIVGLWLVCDCLAHSILAGNQCGTDKEEGINRIYLPVPIPVVRENELKDAERSGLRKIILMVYVAVSLVFTIILSIKMGDMSPSGRGFGPMTCTHLDSNTARETFDKNCNWGHDIKADE